MILEGTDMNDKIVNDKPLASFCLISYNQEQYIREAIEGAFSQTYSPLEIILSDDCSSDRTFEIMKEMVAEYNGPHTIILNRNGKNLGIGGHVNTVASLASGTWLTMAAGDDVSYPHRVSVCMDYAIRSPRALAIVSRFDTIISSAEIRHYDGGCSSVTIEEMSVQKYPVLHIKGAVAVWHRQLFNKPLPSGLVHEDTLLQYRAFCGGQILFIPERLVKFRIDVGVAGTLRRLSLDRAKSYADYLIWEQRRNKASEWELFLFEHLVQEFDYLRTSSEYLYYMFARQVRIRRYQVKGGFDTFLSCCFEATRQRDVYLLCELGRESVKKIIGRRGRFFLHKSRIKVMKTLNSFVCHNELSFDK